MELKQRINALAKLGQYLGDVKEYEPSERTDEEIANVLQRTMAENGWFTLKNIHFAIQNWAAALSEENLLRWVSKYEERRFLKDSPQTTKTIAIIMAGNVPLVGFHDFISVLLTGNRVLAKLSSSDKTLLPFLAQKLISIDPEFKDKIAFTEGRLKDFDAVIATGSNNTSRYFEYYFGKYPHIIRKNRNSIAVLTGNESQKELRYLADDIFRYFGLGCRNVSKLYVPKDYDFENFFNAMYSWKEIIHNNKYINNYDYNKAVYLMDSFPLLDNEFLLLKEDQGFSSPIAVVFYEKYTSISELEKILEAHSDQLQCVVSKADIPKALPFGKTQSPQLWDYADGVDTVDFLLNLS